VKQVLLELRPRLSEEKLLVSIAAGIKMQDLQVSLLFKILQSLST
jgi:pyrroline-5-carboxylate reductase